MKYLLFILIFFNLGCATKYMIPGNRFISPETQGGFFRGQIEFQQTGASQLMINTENGSVSDGVLYEAVSRAGFLFSSSLLDQFDFVWSHTGGGNSLIGGKFQFLGGGRTTNSTGHKASLGVLFGANEHETEDRSVEFSLSGREYFALYGYRLSPNIFPYLGLSYATHTFEGKISKGVLASLEPNYISTSRAVSGGIELSFDAFFAKLEASYQQLMTEKTKDRENVMLGYSLGLSW